MIEKWVWYQKKENKKGKQNMYSKNGVLKEKFGVEFLN